jgi:DNA primase
MLDFAKIKEIKLTDVCGRYKIALKFRGDYANAQCPLPTHKEGDKGKSFSVNLAENYWRCFSESCNANNGGKRGGDVINFVAAMEKCREKEAAEKLADWFNVGKEKPPQHIAKGAVSRIEKPVKDSLEHNPSDSGVKYMASIEFWFNENWLRREGETDEVYKKRLLTGIKTLFFQSYKAGQKSKGL